MAITLKEVETVARLAKLHFSEEEKEKFTHQLAEIVTYMEKLNELNTDEVEPTSHVLDIKNVFREDKVEPWLTQEEALANAPAKKQGFFSVPKVIG
ncbi:MAG: Asp-tRNA(Asn)/Glu-tRNA(Gln) amidotransferase subunit GatC [candidate division KSB1 bacterium]|nr:Asp-tRNA(Asn)/Glu-tRNA(Gln) amidotransferase subunit GatC [candidate division KSB1 bacterium]